MVSSDMLRWGESRKSSPEGFVGDAAQEAFLCLESRVTAGHRRRRTLCCLTKMSMRRPISAALGLGCKLEALSELLGTRHRRTSHTTTSLGTAHCSTRDAPPRESSHDHEYIPWSVARVCSGSFSRGGFEVLEDWMPRQQAARIGASDQVPESRVSSFL